MLAAKAAPYVHPKLAAIELEVSQPQRLPPKVDIRKLTDDELDTLEHLVRKAAWTPPDEVQDFVPSDEYLPSDEPSASLLSGAKLTFPGLRSVGCPKTKPAGVSGGRELA
ncbi:MAG: hypothetical protein ACXU9C_25550, partial [Xanthobacteraceae bacterium]